MATTTVSITTEAYARLKKFKAKDQSFSEVILEYMPPMTCGDLLDIAREFEGKPLADPARMKMVREGRGRRSNRRSRRPFKAAA